MATRIKVSTDIIVRGPMFEGRDGPIMREFFTDAKKLVAGKGQEEVQRRIKGAAKKSTGKFAAAVNIQDFAKGQTVIADYPQVLYGPWLEGTSQRNQTTRFKGFKAFKLTRGRLRSQVGQLVQGLLDDAVAKLNGVA